MRPGREESEERRSEKRMIGVSMQSVDAIIKSALLNCGHDSWKLTVAHEPMTLE